MVKFGVKILHWFVLLVTGIALAGVNVIQLSCIHSNDVYFTVRLLPLEEVCPCEEGCTCCCTTESADHKKECHPQQRHSFYKLTDSSAIERGIQLRADALYLPEFYWPVFLNLPVLDNNYIIPDQEIPEMPPSQEFLCTYLC